jgi:hypothetical protein
MYSTALLELLSRTEIWDKCFQHGVANTPTEFGTSRSFQCQLVYSVSTRILDCLVFRFTFLYDFDFYVLQTHFRLLYIIHLTLNTYNDP